VNPERRAEQEVELQFLLRSIADLDREHEAGDVDDTDHATLRDGYTARAAAILRQLERGANPPPAPARSWGRVAAWSALVVAVAITAGLLVARSWGDRSPNDASPTGGTGEATITGMLTQARSLVFTNQQQALELYTQVLDLEPDNVEAITYRAWIVVLASLSSDVDEVRQRGAQTAIADFDEAIALDPDYPDARCFKAITAYRLLADAATARPEMDRCLASNPPREALDLALPLSEEIDLALASPGSTLPPETTAPATTSP
jgi:tetratricopeptide (TPR) repeat protein